MRGDKRIFSSGHAVVAAHFHFSFLLFPDGTCKCVSSVSTSFNVSVDSHHWRTTFLEQ